jgi:Autographiviridae endonuclease VII
LRHRFGISVEEYDELFEEQDGKCAICESVPSNTRLAVDHDHQTNEIRGLLCHPCNRLLGRLENNPGMIYRIQSYVQIQGGSL